MNLQQKLIIFFLGLFFSLLINNINTSILKCSLTENINTKSLVNNSTVWSIDNKWYLPHIENIKNGHGYTLNSNEPEMRVRRTPVYPIFYGIHYYLFGKEKSFLFITFSQVLLFAISSLLIALCVYNFSKNKKWAIITGVCYALSPFIASYNYYTITEAISPSLVVVTLYSLSLYYINKKPYYLILSGILIGVSFLNRPSTGLLLPALAFPLLLVNNNLKESIIKTSLLTLGFVAFISPWVIRNYKVTKGEIILAEKIYHGAPMDFGKAHIELRSLLNTVINPADLSTEALSTNLIKHERNSKAANDLKENYMNSLPNHFYEICPRKDLKKGIDLLHIDLLEKEKLKLDNPRIKRAKLFNLESENKAYLYIKSLKTNYKIKSPFQYYILTPLHLLKGIIFNSNSSNIGSLNPKSNELTIIQKVLKTIMYVLNALLFLTLIPFNIFCENRQLKIIINVYSISTILFFILVFRNYEMRYFLPIFPVLYIALGFFINKLWEYYSSNKIIK
jgi:hypothetical protein